MSYEAIDRQAKDLTEDQLTFYLDVAKYSKAIGKFGAAVTKLVKCGVLLVGTAFTVNELVEQGLQADMGPTVGTLAVAGVCHLAEKFERRTVVTHTVTEQYLKREQYMRAAEKYAELTGDSEEDPLIDYFAVNPIDTTAIERK